MGSLRDFIVDDEASEAEAGEAVEDGLGDDEATLASGSDEPDGYVLSF
jgi:hypothetical protein